MIKERCVCALPGSYKLAPESKVRGPNFTKIYHSCKAVKIYAQCSVYVSQL